MLAPVRHQQILEYLEKNQVATTTRLGELTGASPATIRRDLHALAGRGLMLCALGCSVAYMMSGRYSLYREQRLATAKFSFEVAADRAEDAMDEEETQEKIFPDAPELQSDEEIREEVGLPEDARRTQFNLYNETPGLPSEETVSENENS